MLVEILNIIVLTLLVITGLAIARLRQLFAVAMLTSIYSLLSASEFMLLDAPDVAMTEAAVGAGIVTVLFLGTLALTRQREKTVSKSRATLALVVTLITGATLVYASLDMPHFGARHTPVQTHPIRDKYLHAIREEIGIPNTVSAVLASYRGYDTLGETTVIFTAGIGVLMLLGGSGRRRRK